MRECITSETDSAAQAVQVLRSIAFLHSLDLIHSDLKPENILVKSYSRSAICLQFCLLCTFYLFSQH